MKLRKGMIVTVMNKTLDGRAFVEGKARLIRPSKLRYVEDRWEVEFLGEPGVRYDRHIDIAIQEKKP